MSLPKPYYSHAGQTIYLGDCREILPYLPKVDLVLTDPPYGIKVAKAGRVGGNNRANAKDYGNQSWDYKAADVSGVLELVASGSDAVVWGAQYFDLPIQEFWLVWDKCRMSGNSLSDCELAWTTANRTGVRRIKYLWDGYWQEDMANKEVRYHPTQKPLKVMTWCLSFFPDAQTILDPFMGSGTTLVAAKQLGRKGIGIEIEERYAEIAALRLSQEVMDFGGLE